MDNHNVTGEKVAAIKEKLQEIQDKASRVEFYSTSDGRIMAIVEGKTSDYFGHQKVTTFANSVEFVAIIRIMQRWKITIPVGELFTMFRSDDKTSYVNHFPIMLDGLTAFNLREYIDRSQPL